MSSSKNEFGTVNVRRGDRTREIDLVKQRYNRHRETLVALAADAPSDRLATEYARVIRELDMAIGKLGELEGKRPSDTQPMPAMRTPTEPGSRPLVTPPGMIMPDASEPVAPAAAMPRVAMIIGAGILVLVLIGWLMWKASGERPATHVTTGTTASTATHAPAPVTPVPKPAVGTMSISPASQDYGTIRKGTRAVRQFQVTNNGATPLTFQVARSACRCLYYAYNGTVAPKAKETVTVTVIAAKANRGTLHETVAVTAKNDPSARGSIEVIATIR